MVLNRAVTYALQSWKRKEAIFGASLVGEQALPITYFFNILPHSLFPIPTTVILVELYPPLQDDKTEM